MSYIENPKTKGSGIICAIPQEGTCPIGCTDCFFQSGRSYLEPLEENLPNMPPAWLAEGRVVRVNDGNDSNNKRADVISMTFHYPDKFYNTSIPKHLEEFKAPVVLTVNPGKMTDESAHLLDVIPPNLMFVRVRTNTWNFKVVVDAVKHYTSRDVPVVLTFMAYYADGVNKGHTCNYSFRKRTMNSYWCATQSAVDLIFSNAKEHALPNKLVYTCGYDATTYSCARCGTCLREYYATKERMRSL